MPFRPIWSHDWWMTITPVEVCTASNRMLRVVLVVVHRGMRELIGELLQRDRGCWSVSAIDRVSDIDHDASSQPDLMIVDTADFATVRRHLPQALALARVVVIGPEPDTAYRRSALQCGAGAWLSRDRVGEELCDALRSAYARASESRQTPTKRSADVHTYQGRL